MNRRRYCVGLIAAATGGFSGCLQFEAQRSSSDSLGDNENTGDDPLGDREETGDGYSKLYAFDSDGSVEWIHKTVDNGQETMVGNVVASDKAVFYTAASQGPGNTVVRGLDADEGTALWTFELEEGSPIHVSYHESENLVYANNSTGYRLDAATGDVKSEHDHPTAGGLGVHGDIVYSFSRDGIAFDTASGEIEWSVDIERRARTVPAYASGTLYYGTEAGWVTAMDASDGTIRWEIQLENTISETPVVTGDVIWVIGGPTFYALRRADGKIVYERETETYARLVGQDTYVRVPLEDDSLTVYEIGEHASDESTIEPEPAWTAPPGTNVNYVVDDWFVGEAGKGITAFDTDGTPVWETTEITLNSGYQPWTSENYATVGANGRIYIGTRMMGG